VKTKRELARADADTDACVVYREPIRRGASRCVHCQSAQDWTRYVARWSSFWTAVLALVPLWSGAFALRQLAFPDHRPQVKIRPIACTEQGLVLAVTNSGKGPGLVGESSLHVEVGGRAAAETFDLIPAGERIAMPDSTWTLKLEPRVRGTTALLPTTNGHESPCEYRGAIRVDAFEGPGSTIPLRCPCPP
jgi:hypothetical protein